MGNESVQTGWSREAEIAIRGMEDSIIRINSGTCRIVGYTIDTANKKHDDDIFIAFDYGKKRYRLDSGIKDSHLFIRSLQTHDYYYEVWKPGSFDSSAHRYPLAEIKTAPWLNMVDIQALPYFIPLGPRTPFDFQNIYQPTMFAHKLLECKNLDDDIVYLKFDMKRKSKVITVQQEYWLSQSKGFLPLRCEYSVGYSMDISWKSINDTWVPTSYLQQSRDGFGVSWKIDWESVNEPIDAALFDYNRLTDTPVPLYSNELGESVRIGTLGPTTEMGNLPSRGANVVKWFFMITGIFLITLGLGKKFYDWKMKQS